MPPLLLPPALQPGDTIGVIAPAGVINPNLLAAGIAELERLGYQVKYQDSITAATRYTAGTVQRRANELNEMLADKSIKAIFAARGGYGAMHLLEHLDPQAIAQGPKIVMGYSDLTALLVALYQQYGWVTFHGPMVLTNFAGGTTHYDLRSFTKALTRPIPLGPVECSGTTVIWPGRARAPLVGGCLSLIVALIGTPWELEIKDTLLFLEDINAKPYQLDRMLTQLRLTGKLQQVKGLIFGEMIDCHPSTEQGYLLTEVLADLTQDLGIPVLFGLRAGHGQTGNLTLPLGVEAALECGPGRLSFTAPAVDFA